MHCCKVNDDEVSDGAVVGAFCAVLYNPNNKKPAIGNSVFARSEISKGRRSVSQYFKTLVIKLYFILYI